MDSKGDKPKELYDAAYKGLQKKLKVLTDIENLPKVSRLMLPDDHGQFQLHLTDKLDNFATDFKMKFGKPESVDAAKLVVAKCQYISKFNMNRSLEQTIHTLLEVKETAETKIEKHMKRNQQLLHVNLRNKNYFELKNTIKKLKKHDDE